MAARSLVDLLACARLVAGIGPRQLEQQGDMAGCRGLPCSSGIRGKLDLLWGHQGMSL